MKTSLIVIGILVLGGIAFLFSQHANKSGVTVGDYKNTAYTIEGTPITLTDGVSSVPAAPGSASMVETRYFGNEATGDLNGDGRSDVAFLLTQSGSGSGTFYYLVAALNTPTGYQGTNGVFLGDRIAPQSTEIHNGEVIVNYADRTEGESMTTQPSVGISKSFRIEQGELVAAQ